MRTWREEYASASALIIHVNLSGKQFLQPDLVTHVADVLRETAMPPELLNLEITESSIVSNPDTATAILAQLKALGVKISIDDFGTGYSSLSYLHQFPLDTLKIDRSFVRAMTPDHAGIVRTIVGLAHAMRLQVVAEGVETPTQLAQLSELGCEFSQGYLFAPALEAPRASVILASGPIPSLIAESLKETPAGQVP
jgi:EAL domain-containing protein (putative c-di-GMP-specific phosphodiesterase class I)